MIKLRISLLNNLGVQARVLRRPLCALFAVLELCGCATFSQEPIHVTGGNSSGKSSSLVEFVAKGTTGAQTQLDDPTHGRIIITVGATYISALGVTCRKAKVQTADKDVVPVFTTVCQDSDKKWRELPQVMAPGAVHSGQQQGTW
jgi:hypothetical protein